MTTINTVSFSGHEILEAIKLRSQQEQKSEKTKAGKAVKDKKTVAMGLRVE